MEKKPAKKFSETLGSLEEFSGVLATLAPKKKAPRKPKIVPEDPCLLDTMGGASSDYPRAYFKRPPFGCIVGIDISMTSTGIACSDRVCTVESIGHDGASVSEWADRIDDMSEEICERVRGMIPFARVDMQNELKFVVIEGPSYGNGMVRYAHERAGLYWAIVIGLKKRGITVYTVPPKTVKKVLSGNGAAKKPEQLANARKYFGMDLTIKNDDEADALGLMAIGIYWTGHGIPLRMSPSRFRAPSIVYPPWDGRSQKKITSKKKKVAVCDGSKAIRTITKKTKEQNE